jgi:prevent-host-death family protein
MIYTKGVKMPIIKPISDLRNKSNEISKLAHNSNEPIFITKNGEGDLVVMSMKHYSNMQLKLDLLSKLSVAQNQKAEGDKGRTLNQVMTNIRKTINIFNYYQYVKELCLTLRAAPRLIYKYFYNNLFFDFNRNNLLYKFLFIVNF